MRKIWLMLAMLALGIGIGLTISARLALVQAQAKPGAGFAAVPGSLGSEDLTGPYDVVKNWPQDVSTLPGNEKWTYGAGEGPTARVKACSRKARIAFTCCSAANCRRWLRPRQRCCRKWDPASPFQWLAFGATLPWHRCRGRAERTTTRASG
jgi:hypothetical protein